MTGTITLYKGDHTARECQDGKRCLFEWYNWLTRQRDTDDCPPGVSPVLHRFGMQLNDALPDDRRQELVRFLPNGADRLAGTAEDGLDEARGYLALDWQVRTFTPAWLDLAELSAEASVLRDFRRIADLAAAQAVRPHVLAAREKAAAAWAAAGDAAWAAAGDGAAWAAAWAAARAAAGDAAGDAARDAARDALAPTVTSLQDSAVTLYDLMITGTWPS